MIFYAKHKINFERPIYYHKSDCFENVDCNCLKIDKVDMIKYLGITIDCHLSWKEHIKNLKNKLHRSVRSFYFLRDICPRKVLVNVYHALIGTQISYGLTCWGGTYISSLYPIIILQKSFLRIITKSQRTSHSWPLFSQLKILPIRNLYIFKVLKVFFMRSSLEGFARNVRHGPRHILARVPKTKLTMFQNFYTFNAPRLFNIASVKFKILDLSKGVLCLLKQWLFTVNDTQILLKPPRYI